jgi:predicted transcriptional regulator
MKQLGPLERRIMDILWGADQPMSVHDLLEALDDADTAYTTILTVVSNLYSKDFVRRDKVSRSFFYTPTLSREEMTVRALRDILSTSGDSTAVLTHFAQTASDAERETLRAHLPRRRRSST